MGVAVTKWWNFRGLRGKLIAKRYTQSNLHLFAWEWIPTWAGGDALTILLCASTKMHFSWGVFTSYQGFWSPPFDVITLCCSLNHLSLAVDRCNMVMIDVQHKVRVASQDELSLCYIVSFCIIMGIKLVKTGRIWTTRCIARVVTSLIVCCVVILFRNSQADNVRAPHSAWASWHGGVTGLIGAWLCRFRRLAIQQLQLHRQFTIAFAGKSCSHKGFKRL